jgi:hypothetical protein
MLAVTERYKVHLFYKETIQLLANTIMEAVSLRGVS